MEYASLASTFMFGLIQFALCSIIKNWEPDCQRKQFNVTAAEKQYAF